MYTMIGLIFKNIHSSSILFTKASLRIEIFSMRASSGLEVLVVSMDISNTNTEMTDDII